MPPPGGGDQDRGQGYGWGEVPPLPTYGHQGPQAYGQFGAPAPGPIPVAQPGIIPLRPLTMGEIYDGAFKAIRANPMVMFGLAVVVVAVVTIIQGAVTWGLNEELNRFAGQVDPTMQDVDDLYGTLTASLVPSLVSAVVSFVVTTALNGVLIHSISQSVIGRTLPLGELWRLVRPQLLRLLGLTLLISVALVVGVVLCFVPAIAAGLSGELGLTVGLGLLGLLLALLVMLFLVVATVLATPTLVLERSGVLASLRRSWELTRTSFWRIAGIYLLTMILVGIVAGVISAPIGLLGEAVGGVTGMTMGQLVASIAASAITTPFVAGVISLLYIDIRIRYEGLDTELAAAAAEGA